MSYKVGAYVKLAKLWERKRAEAEKYHKDYYAVKYADNPDVELKGVFIDITGKKEIWRRPQMIQLLMECRAADVNCIVSQTKAYLAANTEDFFFLIHYLFSFPHRIDIVTEDPNYNINTIANEESQKENLMAAATKYVRIEGERYVRWLNEISAAMEMMEALNG